MPVASKGPAPRTPTLSIEEGVKGRARRTIPGPSCSHACRACSRPSRRCLAPARRAANKSAGLLARASIVGGAVDGRVAHSHCTSDALRIWQEEKASCTPRARPLELAARRSRLRHACLSAFKPAPKSASLRTIIEPAAPTQARRVAASGGGGCPGSHISAPASFDNRFSHSQTEAATLATLPPAAVERAPARRSPSKLPLDKGIRSCEQRKQAGRDRARRLDALELATHFDRLLPQVGRSASTASPVGSAGGSDRDATTFKSDITELKQAASRSAKRGTAGVADPGARGVLGRTSRHASHASRQGSRPRAASMRLQRSGPLTSLPRFTTRVVCRECCIRLLVWPPAVLRLTYWLQRRHARSSMAARSALLCPVCCPTFERCAMAARARSAFKCPTTRT